MESRKLKKIPAFFKPFVAEDRERRLLIPPFFSEFMKDRLPNNAIIRDRKENYWPVEVLQREKKKFFEAGWTKFVQDKNVQYGDFLVFEYDGGSFFDVRILESWHVRRNLVLKRVPTDVINDFNLKLPEKIDVCDEQGRTWPLAVKKWGDGRTCLAKGWRAFWRWNGVKLNDKCLCEFVPGNDGSEIRLRISIIRAEWLLQQCSSITLLM
ncbi:hypothetical protein DCAR_0933331 [Daucus carota subsp. sativus]|uniref:TF-B3 domain-containing protein n=1 Tax=Daucus carota subsp. sativus TaxID=79200 RepID=A0AAF1BC10_DAUCS|nr:hypothetical protein DCAR_0933331 [Daucus carota subsp. sativus]